MKSKHCICGEKIANSIFNSYRICDTIPHKSTIAALCYRSAIAKQLASWHNRLRSCLFSIIIIHPMGVFVNRNSESFTICTKLLCFQQFRAFFCFTCFSSLSCKRCTCFYREYCKIQRQFSEQQRLSDNACKDEAVFYHL